jgi:hypothetical protein
MIRALLAALLALSLTCCSATNCMGGSIVYNIVNYADLQNGYKLSGTITTDGAIGTLTSADITAWSFSVTGPTSYQGTSQAPGATVFADNLTASATELTLAPIIPIPGEGIAEELQFFGATLVGATLDYARVFFDTPPVFGADEYESGFDNDMFPPWSIRINYPPGVTPGGSAWIIATVATIPEPGTLTLALLGGTCISAVVWMRRCRRSVSRSDR